MGQDIYRIETELPNQWKLFYYAVADAQILERQKEALASQNKHGLNTSGGRGRKVLKPPKEFISRG